MKYTKLNQMRNEAEVKAVFGKKSFSNAKRVVNVDAAIMQVESYTFETATNEVLTYYKRYINQLPKEVRGNVKKAFCDAIRDVLSVNGILLFVDSNTGRINPVRVFNKVRKADAPDLCQLITNLVLMDAADGAAEHIDKEYKVNAAVDTLVELLSEYKIDVAKFQKAV